jgi:hypothetical protein
MFGSERHEPLLPFPKLPEAVKNRHSISDLALRRFGIYESDLNVDFSAPPRPVLVTEILDCCTRDALGQPVDRNFFWDLTVGTRTECLLRLAATDDQAEIPLTLRCPNRACGRELEIGLTVGEISELQQQAFNDVAIFVTTGEGRLKVRRPTGNDQLAWLGQRFEVESEALQQMLGTLVVEGAPSRESLEVIGRVMDEHDPLVNFTVQVQCPDCEQQSVCEIDLEELSLNRLRKAQFRLLAAVHRLAAHYHWSEEEIFKVPHWRRDYYLGLLEREKQA